MKINWIKANSIKVFCFVNCNLCHCYLTTSSGAQRCPWNFKNVQYSTELENDLMYNVFVSFLLYYYDWSSELYIEDTHLQCTMFSHLLYTALLCINIYI